MSKNVPGMRLPKNFAYAKRLQEQQRITVKVNRRRYGKEVTVVEGFDVVNDLHELSTYLKSKFACGGTVKEIRSNLGNHLTRMKEVLMKGFC